MTRSRWNKRGLIFRPSGDVNWSRTHAQVPTALVIGDRVRLYYATRDEQGRSRTSFVEVSREDPSRILYRHSAPVMELGEPGTHDEDGVMVGSVVVDNDRILLYYTGWSRGGSVPYRVAVGVAISIDGGMSFTRPFEGPVVDRTAFEPYMTMSPYVLVDGNGLWRMWYGSGLKWVTIEGKFEPVYAIKYAESDDGLNWTQPNTLCIAPRCPLEANTRPSVRYSKRGYEMWFCYRHSRDFRDGTGAYHIGYALSADGKDWRRQPDPAGMEPSIAGWDSKMMAYPNVVEVGGRLIMFYNGNGFGSTGIGYATLIYDE
jgi:hypothetical protein